MATPTLTPEQNDLRPEKGIFWPAVIGVLLIALPMLFFPKASEEIIGAIYTPFSLKFGSLSGLSDCASTLCAAATVTSNSAIPRKSPSILWCPGSP